jgi:hypothetical protein
MLLQSLQRASYFSGVQFELWNELWSFGENFNEKVDKHSGLGRKTPTSSSERKYGLSPLILRQ